MTVRRMSAQSVRAVFYGAISTGVRHSFAGAPDSIAFEAEHLVRDEGSQVQILPLRSTLGLADLTIYRPTDIPTETILIPLLCRKTAGSLCRS